MEKMFAPIDLGWQSCYILLVKKPGFYQKSGKTADL
jgi:hypothetical protein